SGATGLQPRGRLRIAHGKRAVNDVPEEIVRKTSSQGRSVTTKFWARACADPLKSFGVERLYNDTSHYACGCAVATLPLEPDRRAVKVSTDSRQYSAASFFVSSRLLMQPFTSRSVNTSYHVG